MNKKEQLEALVTDPKLISELLKIEEAFRNEMMSVEDKANKKNNKPNDHEGNAQHDEIEDV